MTRAVGVWALGCALAVAAPALGRERDAVALGRAHLRKANALAGGDRCEAAIREYTLAYEALREPAILFSRAGCRRRMGEAAKAADDYRAFLKAAPNAPNRAEIESTIARLTPKSTVKSPPPAGPNGGPSSEGPLAVSALVSPASPDAPTSAAILEAAPSESPDSVGPRHDRRWIWTAVGIAVAVAGGAAGAYFALRTPGASAPSTTLGSYKF